jgi:signal transduction histidine kinase
MLVDRTTLPASPATRPAIARYGLAALTTAAAVTVYGILRAHFGGQIPPFLLYYPAILLTGWFGGLGPALFTLGLSASAAQFVAAPGPVPLALFGLLSLIMSLLVDDMHRGRLRSEVILREQRDQERSLRQAEEDRHRLLEETRRAYEEAEAANRVKDEFLATLSHELRTPLNAMMGWAQILQSSPADLQTLARGLDSIVRNARAQGLLIDELLDLSRIVTGKLRVEMRPVDPAEVIRRAVEAVSPAAEAKRIRLVPRLDRPAPPVAADPDRLQQIVWNLLANAVKFTPSGGQVEIGVERANSYLEIAVSDNGIGISPEFLPHVFDRFRQLDSSTTRTQGGLGLGLSIVRHLVELHGGTVRVESPGLGRGSKFVVTLPLSSS